MRIQNKKIAALALAMTMAFTCAACGGGGAPADGGQGTNLPADGGQGEGPPNTGTGGAGSGDTGDATTDGGQGEDPPSAGTALFPFEFTATDIYGNTLTQASMGEKELFFIHYWGTWCPPCIAEMPDLAKLVSAYEDRVGFLMLIDDFDNVNGVRNIYNRSNFPDTAALASVCARTTFASGHQVIDWINTGYVPTTVIIDAAGNMLEQLIGAYGERYSSILDTFLQP